MRDPVPNTIRDTADDRGVAAPALLRLLAVEDEFAYVGFIDMMLRTMHPGMFELSHAPSLHRAIEHLEATPFDLVLLDLGLGDATGLEALQALITAAPDTPVVVLSGDDSLALAARSVQAGGPGHFPEKRGTRDNPA